MMDYIFYSRIVTLFENWKYISLTEVFMSTRGEVVGSAEDESELISVATRPSFYTRKFRHDSVRIGACEQGRISIKLAKSSASRADETDDLQFVCSLI